MKDYAELVVSASAMSGDPDVSNYAETLMTMTEKKLSRAMRVRQAVEEVTRTTNSSGVASLPRGFIDVVYVFDSDNKRMYPADLSKLKGADAYQRDIFSISGNDLHTNRPNDKVRLTFYEELPPLSEHGCNWLLEAAPDIYLQALLQEIALKNADFETASTISGYLQGLISTFVRFNKVAVIAASRGGSKVWP